MKFIYFLVLILWVLTVSQAWARPFSTSSEEITQKIVSAEDLGRWRSFEGKKVLQIEIEGLVRTKRQAVLWQMKTKIGQEFRAEDFARDLQALYNTGNLYDLQGDVSVSDEGVVTHIKLKDKWTLLPAFGAQGGGGSSTIGGGLFDSNLAGYNIQASFFTWQFNGAQSYDLFFNQEYFADTQYMWSFDLQDNIEVETPHLYAGQSLSQFAWRRTQKEFMVGDHFEGPWRIFIYASLFQDSVFQNNGNLFVNTQTGLQNKLYPKAIYGKVNWNNYQENGFELTVQPSFSNLIGPNPFYSAIEVDLKRVWVTGFKNKDNLAVYLSGSTIGIPGPNYQLQAGGYYNIRGFTDMREVGRNLSFANFEYRPYITETRLKFFDLDLVVLQACVFSDFGSAWGDSSLTGDSQSQAFHPLWSAGAGLRMNWVKFAGAILRFDWAQTLSPNEGIGFSFGVGQFF